MTWHLHEATYPQLVNAWLSAIEPFAELSEGLSDAQWAAPSILPGWTNADIVAHVVGIERDLLGEPTPAIEPDWEALPHADDLFSRYTELAVALRRDMSQREVCAELRKTIAARREALAKEPGALGEVVRGPGGWELPRGVVLRMRCFDIWVHDQDIRAGIGVVGDLGTDAAWVASERMLAGLGRTWARDVAAPADVRARIKVTGPGVEFAVVVHTDAAGRGHTAPADAAPVSLDVTMTWPVFAALSCGRNSASAADVTMTGDTELGSRLIQHFNVAP